MSEGLNPEVAILNVALELPADQRAAYLDRACAGNAALRQQVEALLQADEQAGGFLDTPPTGFNFQRTELLNLTLTEKPGDRIGRYRLLQQIGAGGCGVVYMAEQEEPVRRRVALKVIKLGMDTKEVIVRFEAERQALALMDHLNIAKVFDAGATGAGRPYFVMELVRGTKITDLCDENKLSTEDRLKLFVQVCQAIQHAHQKGVIHRDIKPSNILVTINDGVPVPKVIDFGIAKATAGRLTDQTLFTAVEQFIGTPAYMSPEQAVMTSLDIDTRSDIYSLGVLLYELLTGRTPFDQKELLAAGLDEMRRTIREVEPVKPSTRLTRELSIFDRDRRKAGTREGEKVGGAAPPQSGSQSPTFPPAHFPCRLRHGPSELQTLISTLRGDLDWIVMKCLEKDRARRYETANGLASDIQRHLKNEPILARPPSGVYRFHKWVRRNKVTFGTAVTVVVAAVLALVILVISNVRIGAARRAENTERQKSDSANRELRQTVNLLELQRAEDFFRAGDAGLGVAHLAAMLRNDPSNYLAASRLMSALVHRNWALRAGPAMRHPEWSIVSEDNQDNLETLCFSPDGRQVLSANRENKARIWDAVTGKSVAILPHGDRVYCANYSPDGARVVTASADGTARIWNPSNGDALTPPLCHESKVYWAEFSRDGLSVVTASVDKTARIWDAATGELRRTLQGTDTSEVLQACFSSDNQQIATGDRAGRLRLWDVDSGELLFQSEARHDRVNTLAFSPDGTRLGTGHEDGTARLWSVRRHEAAGSPLPHSQRVHHVAFSPDSHLLLSASQDGTARLWDSGIGVPSGQPFLHEGGVVFAEFSPDGQKVVTTSMDCSARLWDLSTRSLLCQPLRAWEAVRHAGFSPDGRKLVITHQGLVQVWNIRPNRYKGIETRLADHVKSLAISPDGKALVAAAGGKARVFDSASGRELCDALPHAAEVQFAEFSPDGERMVSATIDGKARVWEWRTGRLIAGPFRHANKIWAARFSPEGDRVATASVDGTARVWDARTGQPLTPPLQHTGEVNVAQFSPDGRLIATASDDNSARLWNAWTGEPVGPPRMHQDIVKWVEFSPDGKKLLTASQDNTAGLWDVQTGRAIVPPLRHTRLVERAAFSPDGRRVVTVSSDRTARIWDAAMGQALTPPLKHDQPVNQAFFTPDGQRIVTIGDRGAVRFWDANTGQPLTESLETGGWVRPKGCCMDVHGRRIAAGGEHGIVRVWDVPPVPIPVPDWFPAFAESIAGIRLTTRGNLEVVSDAGYGGVAQRLRGREANGVYEQVARWFLADTARRAPVPPMDTGDSLVPEPLANGKAIYFDGMDDLVTVPHAEPLNALPITVTTWVKTLQNVPASIGLVTKHIPGIHDGFALFLGNGRAQTWYFRNETNRIWDGGWGLARGFVADGQWHHLAFAADETGGTLYIDGSTASRQPWTGNPGPSVTPTELVFGHFTRSWGGPRFAGQMDEVTLWNRILSRTEVQDLMKTRLTGKEDGLVGYWPFDEGSGTTAKDHTGHGHDGTLRNGPVWVRPNAPPIAARSRKVATPRATRSAISFDQFDGVVDVPHDSALNVFPMTFAAWIKTEWDLPPTLGIAGIARKAIGHMDNGYSVYVEGGRLHAFYFAGASNYTRIEPWEAEGDFGDGFVADGNWHHVAFVVDPGGCRLYLDGRATASLPWIGTPGVTTNSVPLWLGHHNEQKGLGGQMDEVTLWNRALSQAEVQDLMKSRLTGKEDDLVGYWPFDEGGGTIAHDLTGHGHDGTLENGPTWVRPEAPLAE